ncbi:hypothetical protein M378DRAFT_93378, partial [Amanita muscaria Koide BX008]
MAANTSTSCYGWLADSATTSHIACDENQFSVYQKINETNNAITLNDILHIPTATDNLFSVGRFVERGNTFFADKSGGYFYDGNGHLIMTSKLENALFSLNASISSEKVNVVQETRSWLEWH